MSDCGGESADQPRGLVYKIGKFGSWRKGASEAGDTLIEVLIALTVIGLTATALLGAFTTTLSASAQHRNLASLDVVLKSYVEQVTSQLQQQSSTSPTFMACATTATYSSYPALQFTPVTLQGVTYSAGLTGTVQYWHPTTHGGPRARQPRSLRSKNCSPQLPLATG